MKIKRFVADSMREAIRRVREEQGPDAVILSNRRVEGGIEIVAAVDYDEALVRHAARQQETATAAPAAPTSAPSTAPASSPSPAVHALSEFLSMPVGEASPARVPVNVPMSTPLVADSGALAQVRQDMLGLRRLLETQLATLTLGQFRHAHAVRASVMRELARLGLDVSMAREIATVLPEGLDEPQARVQSLAAVAHRLRVAEADPLDTGGVIALVGPTGVGKTTTLAKLAARYAARHGSRQVALICMDHYRIAAQEQLYTYGRRLGVAVYTADDGAALAARLADLADCGLVLIDTAGLGPRDARLPAQLNELAACGRPLRTYLTIAANSQAPDLEQALQRFAAAPLSGALLTKLDESTRLGGALSVLIRHQLPIAYVCDGQRVPEDLHRADARQLVKDAVRLARNAYAGSDPHFIEDDIDASALAFV